MNVKQRLEELRIELRAERISYAELAELQGLAPHIEPGDTELLEAAGVPEFADDDHYGRRAHPLLQAVEPACEFAPNENGASPITEVQTGDWQLIISCRFGEARLSKSINAKWSGDSHRYDIFVRKEGVGRATVAVRFEHGGGCGWLLADDGDNRGESNLIIDVIAKLPNEAHRWDACHFLCESAAKTRRAATSVEYHRMADAYVNGKLKKKKIRGTNNYSVSVV